MPCLAWAFEDRAAADKAREFLRRLETNWDTNTVLDMNIRMAKILMGCTNTWDLLSATPWFPDEESAQAESKITDITGQFFAKYLEQDFYRDLLLRPAQNNHPIRTADALGYVALAFPEHPARRDLVELVDLGARLPLGPGRPVRAARRRGRPRALAYSGFAWGPRRRSSSPSTTRSMARWPSPATAVPAPTRTRGPDMAASTASRARSRSRCAAGSSRRPSTGRLSLRSPGAAGPRSTTGSSPRSTGARCSRRSAEAGSTCGTGSRTARPPRPLEFGADLIAHHLLYVDDAVASEAPRFLTRFFPDTGHAVFRSDWGDDARWLLLLAEHGSARKAIHDHVDGTSFSLAAYGEYLLIDAGYYKPDSLDNAKTSQSPSHNVVLIDGRSAPDKGLFNDFGDADAFLRNTHDGDAVDYAEAHQDYQDTHVERSVAFIDGRYFVVGDRLSTSHPAARARVAAARLRGAHVRRHLRAPPRRRPMGAGAGGRRGARAVDVAGARRRGAAVHAAHGAPRPRVRGGPQGRRPRRHRRQPCRPRRRGSWRCSCPTRSAWTRGPTRRSRRRRSRRSPASSRGRSRAKEGPTSRCCGAREPRRRWRCLGAGPRDRRGARRAADRGRPAVRADGAGYQGGPRREPLVTAPDATGLAVEE